MAKLISYVFYFNEQFSDATTWLAYLANSKWKDGYQCRKCSCTVYTKGYHPFARRCKNCRYDELDTAYAVFHNIKFNLLKHFLEYFDIAKRKVSLLTNGQKK